MHCRFEQVVHGLEEAEASNGALRTELAGSKQTLKEALGHCKALAQEAQQARLEQQQIQQEGEQQRRPHPPGRRRIYIYIYIYIYI